MRKELIVLIVLLCSSFAFAGPQDFSGLVSYWKADNNPDDSQDSNNGTLQGGTTYAASKLGLSQAFVFDGVDDYVDVGTGSNLDITTELTISAWIRSDQPSGRAQDSGFIFSKRHIDDNTYSLFLRDSDHSQPNTVAYQSGSGAGRITSVSTTTITDTDWHFVAVTHDSSNNVKLYIDGVNVGNSTGAALVSQPSIPALIGIKSDTFGYNFAFDGLIDEVAIWNRALSDTEIQSLYDSYEEQGEIPEVNNNALKIFVILIVALLVGALFLRKN